MHVTVKSLKKKKKGMIIIITDQEWVEDRRM